MAYYKHLEFNDALFLSDAKLLLEDLHQDAVKKTIESINGSPLADVWKDPYVETIDLYKSKIITDSINAFIKIYGSGSKMDTTSPFYKDYISSEVFNRERLSNNNKVMYRPAEPYADYDWEHDSRQMVTRYGSGREGVISGWGETSPNPKNMQDVLDAYLENFAELFEKDFCPKAEDMMSDKKYWEIKRVEV